MQLDHEGIDIEGPKDLRGANGPVPADLGSLLLPGLPGPESVILHQAAHAGRALQGKSLGRGWSDHYLAPLIREVCRMNSALRRVIGTAIISSPFRLPLFPTVPPPERPPPRGSRVLPG